MAYPAQLSVETPEKLSRGHLILRILFGWLYIGLPHGVCLALYGIAVFFVAIIAFFAVLFTAKYPPGLFKFVEGYFRWSWRMNAYWFFMTDKYPPFSGKPEA